MQGNYPIRLVKRVLTVPLVSPVSIPLRNAILGHMGRSLIMDHGLLRVEPSVVS
jgi:hypothetical protein